jgi:peroxiredoxin
MLPSSFRLHFLGLSFAIAGFFVANALAPKASSAVADNKRVAYTDQEKTIAGQLHHLRRLPDDDRAEATKQLALQIRQLPATPNKLMLAGGLATLSTAGDFGHDTLQEVATTLAMALQGQPQPGKTGEPDPLYVQLASLVRYEHMQVKINALQFSAAMAKLEADDAKRQQADFTLIDLQGKSWNLKSLGGKVVLVNFWATWCPPCRKEMPDLESLYLKFKDQGLVVLAISDESAVKVNKFLAAQSITYPVLLDPGRKVNQAFLIEGLPKSFVFDRSGKLVTQSIDTRTRGQFLEMLAQAGLK